MDTHARLLDLIRQFDAAGGWNVGFRSCAAWLSWRIGLDLGAARERVRVARALGALPRLAEALARGELSYAKVRALTRIGTPENEEQLLAVGKAGTAEHVERIVRGWRKVDRLAEARETARQHASRSLYVRHDDDGTVIVRGRLTAEVGTVVMQALAAARETLYRHVYGKGAEADPPTMDQQQADALGLLAETALHHGMDPGAPAERYQVVVHVDAPVLADGDEPGQSILENGTYVSAETSRRLACDASLVVMEHAADGRVLEATDSPEGSSDAQARSAATPVGWDAHLKGGDGPVPATDGPVPSVNALVGCADDRAVGLGDAPVPSADGRVERGDGPAQVGVRRRTVSPALRRALVCRDHGCRFPGCGLPFGEGHHIRHWANGGPTTLSNLTLLCRRHHRAVHEEGFHVDRLADGVLQFRRPDGKVLPDVPPPPATPGDPVAALRAQHEAACLHLHARTLMASWLGERLDLGWAIGVLHPRAR